MIDYDKVISDSDRKFLSNCLEMLRFNIDFVLDNAHHSLFSEKMYGCLKRIQLSVIEARSQYVNELRFNESPFSSPMSIDVPF